MSFYVSLTSDYEAGQPVSNFTTPLNTMINFERDYNVAIINMSRVSKPHDHSKAAKSTAIAVGVKMPPSEYPQIADAEKVLIKEYYEAQLLKRGTLYFHVTHGSFAFTWKYGTKFQGTFHLQYPTDGFYFEKYF